MIRFRIKQLLADKEFKEKRKITLQEVADVTGIGRATLSRVTGTAKANTTTDVIDKLCSYFECSVSELMEHYPD